MLMLNSISGACITGPSCAPPLYMNPTISKVDGEKVVFSDGGWGGRGEKNDMVAAAALRQHLLLRYALKLFHSLILL